MKDDTYDDIAAIISSQDKDQITLSNTTHNTIDQTIENTNTNTTTSNLAQDALCHVSTATNTTTVSTEVGSEDVNEFRRKFRRVNVAEHQSVIVDDMGPIWGDIALGLSADSDVLLFPSDDAVDAEDFDWFCRSTIQLLDQSSSSMNNRTTIETATRISSNIQSNSVSSHSSNNLTNSDATTSSSLNTNKKWRLVVLEASWMHAKGVYRKINLYREKYKLPPIPCVRLNDITGQYWKFHEQGHAAVSSIEAIAYAAKAAGSTDETFHKLLTLFRLQKYRVLKRIRDGGKPPKAIKISGTGPGSWDSVLARALDE